MQFHAASNALSSYSVEQMALSVSIVHRTRPFSLSRFRIDLYSPRYLSRMLRHPFHQRISVLQHVKKRINVENSFGLTTLRAAVTSDL